MSVKLTIALFGGHSVTIEEEKILDAIHHAAFWSAIPKKCPVHGCKSTELRFSFRTPTKGTQTFKYPGVQCNGTPAHEFGFNQNANGSTLFIKHTTKWGLVGSGDPAEVEDDAIHQTPSDRQQFAKDPEDSLALNLYNSGKVSKVLAGYSVDGQLVTKEGRDTICTCTKFKREYENKGVKDYACEHIRAVRLFANSSRRSA